MKNTQGFSLLELLIAVFLLSLISLAATKAFSLQSKSFYRIQKIKVLSSKIEFLQSLISKYYREANNFKSISGIKLNTTIQTASKSLALKPGSLAISFLITQPNIFYVISKNDFNKFCKYQNNELQQEDSFSRFLVFTIDGFSLANGKVQNSRNNSPACPNGAETKFQLQKSVSVFNSNQQIDFNKIIFIYPVIDAFSIYQSNSSQLRYLSELTSENQLLADEITEFKVSKTKSTIQIFIKSQDRQGYEASKTFNLILKNREDSFLDVIL